MSVLSLVLIFALLIFVVFVLVFYVAWVVMSDYHYDRTVRPGEKYKVGDREYTYSTLPIVNQEEQVVRILSEEFLLKMRDLYQRVQKGLDEAGIEWWVSGGSLISWYRDRQFNPSDDDLDAHTHFKHAEYLWSGQFAAIADKHGFHVTTLCTSSPTRATKEGACVRFSLKESATPVYDLFFEQEYSETEYAKIDSWNGNSFNYAAKEIWKKEDLFPIRKEVIDDLVIHLPNNPEALLKIQYGPNVMKEQYVANMLTHSHFFVHTFPAITAMFRRHKPEPKKEETV